MSGEVEVYDSHRSAGPRVMGWREMVVWGREGGGVDTDERRGQGH